MNRWFRQHGFALGEACRHLLKAPGNFLLNVLVVAIALTLPFAGLTLLENVRPVSDQLAVQPEISLFMAADTPRERASAVAPDIRRIALEEKTAVKVVFISREKALDTLKDRTGLDEAIRTLGSNPLPDAYVLTISGMRTRDDARRVNGLAERLKTVPGVEYVQVDSAWVERLAALLQIAQLVLLFLAVTLGVVVVAVVFNTIRLQVLTQREEIEVSRLVGATNRFICRPFYYTGALLGLIAGALALLAVLALLHPLNAAIADFARLYASEFRLVTLGLPLLSLLLAISAVLGLLGSLLSVRRHLARSV